MDEKAKHAKEKVRELRNIIEAWRTENEESFHENLEEYDRVFYSLIEVFAALYEGDHNEAMYDALRGMDLILIAHSNI